MITLWKLVIESIEYTVAGLKLKYIIYMRGVFSFQRVVCESVFVPLPTKTTKRLSEWLLHKLHFEPKSRCATAWMQLHLCVFVRLNANIFAWYGEMTKQVQTQTSKENCIKTTCRLDCTEIEAFVLSVGGVHTALCKKNTFISMGLLCSHNAKHRGDVV